MFSIGNQRNITFLSGCIPTGMEQCFNALDDDCNGHVDERCGTPDGLIQLIVAWDIAPIDVDLDVTDENGDLATPDRVTQLGYFKDRDCPKNLTCADQNTETVSTAGVVSIRGHIHVAIRFKDVPSDLPSVHVQLGGHLGPRAISAQSTLARPDDAAEFDITD